MPANSRLSALKTALNYSGYLLPSDGGMQIAGAGFDPHDSDIVTTKGHLQNLDLMPDILRDMTLDPDSFSGRRALRLAVADRLPLAGQISPSRYVLTALGARGLTLAGFLAHSLACRISGKPDFLDGPLASALQLDRLKN